MMIKIFRGDLTDVWAWKKALLAGQVLVKCHMLHCRHPHSGGNKKLKQNKHMANVHRLQSSQRERSSSSLRHLRCSYVMKVPRSAWEGWWIVDFSGSCRLQKRLHWMRTIENYIKVQSEHVCAGNCDDCAFWYIAILSHSIRLTGFQREDRA